MEPVIRPIDAMQAPKHLLLHADPSIARIGEYLHESECIGAFLDNVLVGVCVTRQHSDTTAEIMNIAVDPARQDHGIGTAMMQYCIDDLRSRGCTSLTVGTGCFGDQLVFYHKVGFRAHSVIRDFFVDNYQEPVVEFGVRHRDMLRLELDITCRTHRHVADNSPA